MLWPTKFLIKIVIYANLITSAFNSWKKPDYNAFLFLFLFLEIQKLEVLRKSLIIKKHLVKVTYLIIYSLLIDLIWILHF